MAISSDDRQAIDDAVRRLADKYRTMCLWFLRPDYYPSTTEEQLCVLRYIQRYGDREGFRQAATLARWLSQNSSAPSASS